MSGGRFDYAQYRLADIADSIREYLSDDAHNDFGNYPTPLPADIRAEFEEGIRLLERAQVYAQRIDWLLSGDDGEDSFRKRLAEELAALPASPVLYESRLEPTHKLCKHRQDAVSELQKRGLWFGGCGDCGSAWFECRECRDEVTVYDSGHADEWESPPPSVAKKATQNCILPEGWRV